MNKKINVKPVDVLTIEFADGTTFDAKFTALAVMTLDSEFGGLKSVLATAGGHPYETCAKLLYCSMKACDPDMTYARAQALVSDFDIRSLCEVTQFLTDALHESVDVGETPAPGNRKNRRASR